MLDTCICLVGGREHLLGMCCVSNWLICVVCTYIQWTCIIRFSFPPFTIVDDSWRDNGGKRVQCISMQIVSVCVCVCVCACTHSGCVFCSWHCYQYSFYQWHCYYWKHCPLEVRVEEEEELAIPHHQFTHQPSWCPCTPCCCQSWWSAPCLCTLPLSSYLVSTVSSQDHVYAGRVLRLCSIGHISCLRTSTE